MVEVRYDPPSHYARCLLDVTGDPQHHGYAGDFARQLIELALKCDEHNLKRLGLGFPTAVEAVKIWRADPDRARRLAEVWTDE